MELGISLISWGFIVVVKDVFINGGAYKSPKEIKLKLRISFMSLVFTDFTIKSNCVPVQSFGTAPNRGEKKKLRVAYPVDKSY